MLKNRMCRSHCCAGIDFFLHYFFMCLSPQYNKNNMKDRLSKFRYSLSCRRKRFVRPHRNLGAGFQIIILLSKNHTCYTFHHFCFKTHKKNPTVSNDLELSRYQYLYNSPYFNGVLRSCQGKWRLETLRRAKLFGFENAEMRYIRSYGIPFYIVLAFPVTLPGRDAQPLIFSWKQSAAGFNHSTDNIIDTFSFGSIDNPSRQAKFSLLIILLLRKHSGIEKETNSLRGVFFVYRYKGWN